MALIPDPNPAPQMRTRDEVLDQLRAVRRQYRRGHGPLRRPLQEQHGVLCWVLGATPEESRLGTFLGGILNVDF